MSDFGKRLKEERLKASFTQVGFAEKLGVTRSTYNRYENNLGSPDPEFMCKLDDAGCDIYYILTGKGVNGSRGSENTMPQEKKVYENPNDALNAVLLAQDELGITLGTEPLKTALEYAYKRQAPKDDVVEFIKAAYTVAGVELPNKDFPL